MHALDSQIQGLLRVSDILSGMQSNCNWRDWGSDASYDIFQGACLSLSLSPALGLIDGFAVAGPFLWQIPYHKKPTFTGKEGNRKKHLQRFPKYIEFLLSSCFCYYLLTAINSFKILSGVAESEIEIRVAIFTTYTCLRTRLVLKSRATTSLATKQSVGACEPAQFLNWTV